MSGYFTGYSFYEIGGLIAAYNSFGIESPCDADNQCIVDDDIFGEALSDGPKLFICEGYQLKLTLLCAMKIYFQRNVKLRGNIQMIVITAITLWCLACRFAAGYVYAYIYDGENDEQT